MTMRLDIAHHRARIESLGIEDARTTVRRMVRRAVRRQIWNHGQANFIDDFDDVQLVGQRHRDRRAAIKAAGLIQYQSALDASTVPELVAIFDAIASHL